MLSFDTVLDVLSISKQQFRTKGLAIFDTNKFKKSQKP